MTFICLTNTKGKEFGSESYWSVEPFSVTV